MRIKGSLAACRMKAGAAMRSTTFAAAARAYTAETRGLEYLGKQPRFGPETPTQLPNEVILVQAIAAAVQRVRGGSQIHGWTHGCDRAELRWAFPSPFTGELQHQITAHGKSHQRKLGNAILLDQVLSNRGHISRKPGMIKSGSAALGTAAIALIHAHHIHSGGQAFFRHAEHVGRFAGTFEAMHDHNG